MPNGNFKIEFTHEVYGYIFFSQALIFPLTIQNECMNQKKWYIQFFFHPQNINHGLRALHVFSNRAYNTLGTSVQNVNNNVDNKRVPRLRFELYIIKNPYLSIIFGSVSFYGN